jgi:hypothetical protein
LQPTSNVTAVSCAQSSKQESEIRLTDEGIQIDTRDEQDAKAQTRRFQIRQPGSNSKAATAVQLRKQELEIVTIDAGRQID